ncbi:MAG: dTDP-4-dehydrorhamnose reductase [Tannerellaceae bacterium]|nr:dTDP-4-dehydrorhamnose reductase [Tannerellaceae bacterium]
MKKILVTGGNGQLGCCIQAIAGQYPGYEFLFTDVDTLDICNRQAVEGFVEANRVDYIINCAAYTAVDKAEDDEATAMLINRDAVSNLAEVAAPRGIKVIHVSTDYVFDGTSYLPYTENAPVCPVSVYGYTKLAGENILQATCPGSVVVRTSWLYSEYGNNFLKTMIRLGSERKELNVIFDQVGTPTYAGDLAQALIKIVEAAAQDAFCPGVYHFSNEGVCSWYDFATAIMKVAGLDCKVCPIETSEYPTRAARPHYSVLNKTKIKLDYKLYIPHWEKSLYSCYEKLSKQS